jgi:uncharacterized protein (TIGR02453 family)
MTEQEPTPFSPETFDFLEELEANNNREWFNAHKARFQEYVESPFLDLIDAVTFRLQETAVPLSGSKKTLFRMNRDVRFSEDKSPYKTNIAALLTPSGTKSEAEGLMYVQIGAAGAFIALGLYRASPKQLAPIRDAIVADAEAFDAVVRDLSSAGLSFWDEDSLIGMPRGYAEYSDHRHAWAIRLKTLVTKEELSREACLDPDFHERVSRFAQGAMPLMGFLRRALNG